MRSLFHRLALTGVACVAISGCGTGGSPLPVDTADDSGGGVTNVSNQPSSGALIAGLLLDGGVVAPANSYSGANTTATDVASANDAGTDPATAGSGKPPADPAGSHLITFSGSGSPQVVLKSSAVIPSLSYSGPTPGVIIPSTYGAIVLYAALTPGATPPASGTPSVAIELTGGSGFATYDLRSTCGALPAKGATPGAGFVRYVCALPPFASASGTTGSVTLAAAVAATATTPATAAVTSSYIVDSDFANPRIPGATGTFTGTVGSLYVELLYAASTSTASTSNVLNLDYLYAEAGTK